MPACEAFDHSILLIAWTHDSAVLVCRFHQAFRARALCVWERALRHFGGMRTSRPSQVRCKGGYRFLWHLAPYRDLPETAIVFPTKANKHLPPQVHLLWI